MAANRLTRDQIILAGLDAVDSPSLDNKERPQGMLTGTLCVGWLQRALDFFYKQFPIKGTLKSLPITIQQEVRGITVPTDFLQDYLNGIVLDGNAGRLTRRSLSYLLAKSTAQKGVPTMYAYDGENTLRLQCLPDKAYGAILWYYSLPSPLTAEGIPPFPDDQVLVDYIEVRCKEWLQAVPKGSALDYMRGQVAALQRAGIGPEPEPDQIELDRTYYGEAQYQRDNWMGWPSIGS